MGNEAAELAAEQTYLDRAYARLEHLQELAGGLARDELADKMPQPAHRVEREARQATGSRRLADLRLGSLSLCFGRIDRTDGDDFHIGRLALDDEDREPLIVDWRAPVAEAFYRATPGDPMGLVRRRHIHTRGRRILGLEDEVLDLDLEAAEDSRASDIVLVGEAALLQALARTRTGRMGDIVATIQSEQDHAIRAPLHGILVVQGGPGTGKTAVALHRAAYLLYRHRFPLEALGMLVVGPNPIFLRYIERVLPSLGENGCRLSTVAQLRPTPNLSGVDSPAAARVKGDARLTDVVARAVAGRERPLTKAVEFPYGAHVIRLPSSATRAIIDEAQSKDGTHNHRRPFVERLLVAHLYARYLKTLERARQVGLPVRDPAPQLEFARTVRGLRQFRVVLERIWPRLTAERLLNDLFGTPALLREATDGLLTDAERDSLARERTARSEDARWTPADIPLLDEADALLGHAPVKARKPNGPPEERGYLVERMIDDMLDQGVLFHGDPDMIELVRNSFLSGEADYGEAPVHPTTGNQLQTFGHVVVDEAQDLSPMAWRMLARRNPSGSMTLVGDLGQASGHWAPGGWGDVLELLPAARQAVAELTVNYRTPSEVMALAHAVLAAEAPDLRPARSVRDAGVHPQFVESPTPELVDRAAKYVVAERADMESGTIGVIAPTGLTDALRDAIGETGDDLPVNVLALDDAKGLEFDSVVVVEPAGIVAENAHGLRALYVALTRTTTRLMVIYAEPLPAPLADATSGVVR